MDLKDYIAPDGGGMLHLGDRQILGGQETTINQNGILFLAYMARACGRTVDIIKAVYLHRSIVSLGKGRLIRRKGDPLRQSHDNVLGWAWFAVTGNHPEWAKEIYDFAKWRFYVYNPHSRFSLDVRCLLQPSHLFILSLAANKRPGGLSCLWFAVSCVTADHSSDYYLKSMLRSDIVRAKQHLLSVYKRKLVFSALELMEKRREKLSRWYKDYYRDDPNHPAVLAQLQKDAFTQVLKVFNEGGVMANIKDDV